MNNEYIKSVFRLDGKNAIVTGGSQGIGRGIAISLAMFGAHVTVTGRNKKMLMETVDIIRARGGFCDSAIVNINDIDQINTFFNEYIKTNESLDIFVNNAGFTVHAELIDTSLSDIDALIDTNLRGAIICLQRAAECMKKRRSGVITIVTSINALNPHPGQGMYSVTKAGLEGAMKALASSLAKYGIRVNSVAPGAIDTAMNTEAFSNTNVLNALLDKIPLGRVGTISDIGDVVAAVSCNAFRYMTGSTIVVDGGMMLRQI